MIYTTGTIAGNGSTITGTGTNFTAAGSLIRVGCTLIALTNPVQVLQLTAITSGTVLSVTPDIIPAIAAGTKFAILLSDSLSVDGLAQDIAETFGMYQKYMGGFADVMNGSSDVTITINGTPVTVPGQKSLAKKGANSDITSLSGLTTALSVTQGGTGGENQADARKNLGAAKSGTNGDITSLSGLTTALSIGQGGTGGKTQADARSGIGLGTMHTPTFAALRVGTDGSSTFSYPNVTLASSSKPAGTVGREILIESASGGNLNFIFRNGLNNTDQRIFSIWDADLMPSAKSYFLYGTHNTTKASDGTIKAASPVVKIFADGTGEANGEAEGAMVERLSVGEYRITGILGLNSDAGWGGTDGGFDIPTDRNKQPLIWLDYEVSEDGSVLVKTYHRTYPQSPEFAQNKVGYKNEEDVFIETVSNGAPVDIPAGQYVSVRVEMPADSVWNQQLAEMKAVMLEAERAAAQQQQDDTNLENLHNA